MNIAVLAKDMVGADSLRLARAWYRDPKDIRAGMEWVLGSRPLCCLSKRSMS